MWDSIKDQVIENIWKGNPYMSIFGVDMATEASKDLEVKFTTINPYK